MTTLSILRYINYMSVCGLVWLLGHAGALCGQDETQEQRLSIIQDVYHLIDQTGSLTVGDAATLLDDPEQFVHTTSDIINFSIKDSVIWLAINWDQHDVDQYLSPGNESTVWRATLYAPDSIGQYVETFHYDHLSVENTSDNRLPFRTVAIPIAKETEGMLLLRIASRRHRNYSLKTGDLSSMTNYLIFKESIPVAFIAFMLSIFIYNMFLFVSTRDIVFVPYLVYLLFVSFAVPFHSGYVLFSTEWMWQGAPFYTVWTSLGYLSGAVFAILYLNLNKTAPVLKNWILVLTSILVVVVPILDVTRIFHVGIMAKIVSTTSLIFNLSLWGSAVYVWAKGLANARFYVFGWLFAISSMVLFILSTNGILPFTNFVEQSFYYGFAMEAALFAFALGDRMNLLKKEKRSLEIEYLAYTTEQNRVLAKQSFMNSHLLRAPLSRIMGLLNVLKFTDTKEESDKLLQHVEDSTLEMDGIAKKMSVMLEQHNDMTAYQEKFEEVKRSIEEEMKEGES